MLVIVVCFTGSHFGGTLCFGGEGVSLLKRLQKMELNEVQIIEEFSIKQCKPHPRSGFKKPGTNALEPSSGTALRIEDTP